MPENSFDVVSKIDLAEVSNAVQQALKEIVQRYDLKDSKSNIELKEKDLKIILASQDEYKLKAVTEILGQKLVKRQVPLKGLSYGEITPATSHARSLVMLEKIVGVMYVALLVARVTSMSMRRERRVRGRRGSSETP